MDAKARQVLGLLCVVQFVTVLDASIVAVALPSLGQDLGVPESVLQYTITLYALTFGGLLVLGGRVADLVGRERTLLVGVVLFGLASACCGLAPSPEALLAARALQGAGAALVSPAALALLLDRFTAPDDRTTALGVWSAVSAAGGAAGLVLGGVLTDTFTWRSVFLVNVPVCLVAAVLALRWLPWRPGRRQPLDVLGALLITSGLAAATYGLTAFSEGGLTDPRTAVAGLGAGMLLAAFALRLTMARTPLIPLRLFGQENVVVANVGAAVLAALIAAQNFFGSLTLQRVYDLSALQTGLAILPVTLLAFVGSALAGRLEGSVGRRATVLAGLGCASLGLALLAGLSPDDSALSVVPGFAVFGLGLGVSFVVFTEAATDGVSDDLRGVASGVLNTSNQVGFAIGLAVFSAVAVATTLEPTLASGSVLLGGYRAAFAAAAGLGFLASVLLPLTLTPHTTNRSKEDQDERRPV